MKASAAVLLGEANQTAFWAVTGPAANRLRCHEAPRDGKSRPADPEFGDVGLP